MKKQINKYINQTLGEDAIAGKWRGLDDLPFYLLDLYDFWQTSLLNKKVIFMAVKKDRLTSAIVKKHMQAVFKILNKDIIYVTAGINYHQRKRLIEQKIAFIVPGNQMYLPMIGVDFREHFKRLSTDKEKKLSPLAQVLLIQQLLGLLPAYLTTKYLSESFSYSAMTINRAFNQLASKNLAKIEIHGRKKHLVFLDDSTVMWSKAQPMLTSPVKHTVYVDDLPSLQNTCIAGESALAKKSMIIAPTQMQYAIDNKLWLEYKKRGVINDMISEKEDSESTIKLEIWKYAPELLTKDNTVDKYSLYLSLKHSSDERIQMALDELLQA